MKGMVTFMMKYMPFFSFLMSFAGLLLLFSGVMRLIAIRKEFAMYFDKRDQLPPDTKAQRKRKIIISWILAISGIILFIISYFI